MSTAPPNFDYKSSMLPDVGGSIHVQGGGGIANISQTTSDDNTILSEYGLQDGGIISDKVDDTTKKAFVQQINSEICSTGKGTSIITDKNCWAVVAVIRALIKHDLKNDNLYDYEVMTLVNIISHRKKIMYYC